MALHPTVREVRDGVADDAEEQAFLEHLRANGVRVAPKTRTTPRVAGKQRPRWLAFLLRTFGKLGHDPV